MGDKTSLDCDLKRCLAKHLEAEAAFASIPSVERLDVCNSDFRHDFSHSAYPLAEHGHTAISEEDLVADLGIIDDASRVNICESTDDVTLVGLVTKSGGAFSDSRIPQGHQHPTQILKAKSELVLEPILDEHVD